MLTFLLFNELYVNFTFLNVKLTKKCVFSVD